MGQSVYAVAGYGVILSLENVENDDHREVLEDLEEFRNTGFISTGVGAYPDRSIWFIGVGASVNAYRTTPGEPVAVDPVRHGVMEQIEDFLDEVKFDDGTTAKQYLDAESFGFHVAAYVS